MFDPHFGVDPDSEKADRLRARQIRAMARSTPLMMLTNALCGLVVLATLYSSENMLFFVAWGAALLSMVVTSMVHSLRRKNRKSGIVSVSQRAYDKATKAASLLAIIWACLPLVIYADTSLDDRIILVAVICGMMGGGALALYMVPRAMFHWVGILTLGCMGSLIGVGTDGSFGVLALLLIYSAAICTAGHSIAEQFAFNVIAEFELTEKSDTIGLLLKDFSENASDWLWEIDETGRVIMGEEGFSRALRTELISLNPLDYSGSLAGNTKHAINLRSLKVIKQHFSSQTSFRDILVSSSSNDKNAWVNLSGKPKYDSKGIFKGFQGVASDVTDAKLAEERIAYLAHNDALTGLVNRENFHNAISMMSDDRSREEPWSIIYLDLDGFKPVNDTMGHAAGDELLTEVAKRLRGSVSDEDIVARLGGDEFAILSKTSGTVSASTLQAEKLIEALHEPYEVSGKKVEVGASIGIAVADREEVDANELLNNADLALYRAKAEGKGIYRFYKHEMDEIIKERRALESDLKKALKNDELSIMYQPLVRAGDFRVVGFEALTRWKHPTRGYVPPSEFIPIAEKAGIIVDIGDWVINEACRQAAIWPSPFTVSVNLSPQQFQSGKIVEVVTEALMRTGLEPSRLELEITEGLFMERTESVIYTLRELKAMGVSIAMDDFGTGYSSLSYLLQFPFDKLKIDRSLINELDNDPATVNVLEAIIKLGNVLGLHVLAEGIETDDQARFLIGLNCSFLQGYLFGRPLLADQVPAFILKNLKETVKNRGQTLFETDISLAG